VTISASLVQVESTIDEAWATEIESRIDAFDAGKIKASSADEVFKRISKS